MYGVVFIQNVFRTVGFICFHTLTYSKPTVSVYHPAKKQFITQDLEIECQIIDDRQEIIAEVGVNLKDKLFDEADQKEIIDKLFSELDKVNLDARLDAFAREAKQASEEIKDVKERNKAFARIERRAEKYLKENIIKWLEEAKKRQRRKNKNRFKVKIV